jgi:molecular chaperone IbpA
MVWACKKLNHNYINTNVRHNGYILNSLKRRKTMNKTLSIWNDLRPFTVGFDSIFDHFDNQLEHTRSQNQTYPPYNINRIDDLNYQVEMALAGFSRSDIDVQYADNQLTVKSVHSDKDEKDTIHRGISKRHFTRRFTVAEDVMVKGAKMEDGMLLIDLEKIVPEEKKPRTIEIK